MAAKKKKKEMAPVLQSMKDYLMNHYMDEMLQEIKACMMLGQIEGFDVDCSTGEVIFDPDSTKLVRAELWRVDRTQMIADCKMRIKFGLAMDGRIPKFMVRFVNFSMEITLDHGITVNGGIRRLTTHAHEDRDLPKLTQFLVPVLSYDDMEVLVLEMLRKYLGEDKALEKREDGAEELAKAMGLKIMHASLHKNHYSATILYLKEGKARVVASGATGTGTDDEDFKEISIPEKTILVNDNRTYEGDIDRDIYHECGHYEWHSMFFELQNLHASDLRLLQYKEKEAEEASVPEEKDVRWIERQASFVGIAGMFPRPVFAELVHQYWKKVADSDQNIGRKYGLMIAQIAQEKQKARTIIKTRLITTGATSAKGAMNYIDGRYIADFAFDTDSLNSGETFVIDRAQFTEMYEKDEAFRKLISTHAFVYADGHVCSNQPHIIRKTERGYMLTPWALAHVDLCCLKFKKKYYTTEQHYRVGELHFDQEYQDSYMMIHSLDIGGLSSEELLEKNMDYMDKLPRRPSKALKKLIEDRVKTQRGLAAASGLSEATISRMCKDDNFNYSIQEITRIVIGLQLPPPLSSLFLEITRFPRSTMVQNLRYQCIIDCMFMEEIETVVETHRSLFEED